MVFATQISLKRKPQFKFGPIIQLVTCKTKKKVVIVMFSCFESTRWWPSTGNSTVQFSIATTNTELKCIPGVLLKCCSS